MVWSNETRAVAEQLIQVLAQPVKNVCGAQDVAAQATALFDRSKALFRQFQDEAIDVECLVGELAAGGSFEVACEIFAALQRALLYALDHPENRSDLGVSS